MRSQVKKASLREMNIIKSPLILAAFCAAYFILSWFFPWEKFQIDSTISVSYFWDLLFCALVGITYRLPLSAPRRVALKGLAPRLIGVVALAIVSILFIQMSATASPFKYLERPVLQLLILAPLVEEFVFRYAIVGASLAAMESKRKVVLLSAILFSISHVPGIWHLPEPFWPFIYVQLGYTFLLGWIIAKARVRSGSVWEPVALHFCFNLCFYVAVIKGWI